MRDQVKDSGHSGQSGSLYGILKGYPICAHVRKVSHVFNVGVALFSNAVYIISVCGKTLIILPMQITEVGNVAGPKRAG